MKKKQCNPIRLFGWKKLFLMMRLTALLLLIGFVHVSASVYSQKTNLELRMKNVTVEQVLQKIEEQSNFYFLYRSDFLKSLPEVSIDAAGLKVEEVLDKIVVPYGFEYEIDDKVVVIRKIGGTSILGDQTQKITVTGKVSDTSGTPLPGVTVVLKGTTIGTITDMDGSFSLANVPSDATMIISFVGMKSQEITISGKTNINIIMEEETIGIDEVVAIGYGVQKKSNVIGSVTAISNKELTSSPVSRISNALAGRLPGVIVQQRSGEPGFDEATILIRGKATLGDRSPLIVIDGIPGRDMNSIDPSDIENLTVLKDASAGIYGARAANGVILITTKRGSEDASPTFKYEFYKGFSSPTILPEMADAATYAQMIREMQTYRNFDETNMSFSLADIEKYKSGEYPWTHPNTNWFDSSLKNYSDLHHHNFSVTGGSKNFQYYTSFGNQYDDGIYKNSGTSYNRYNLRATFDVKINEYLSIGIDLNGSQENRMSPTRTSYIVFNSLVKGKPTDHAIYPNGYIAPAIPNGTDTGITGTLAAGYDDDKRYRSQNMLSATLKVPKIEGLTLSGYYAYDMYFSVAKVFQKPWTNYNFDKAAYLAAGNTGKEDGSEYLIAAQMTYPEPRLTDSYADSKSVTYNFKINYDKTINKAHNINAFVAYENYDYLDKGISAFRRHFVSDALPYLFAGTSEDQSIGSSVNVDARENYFGRLSYNYKEKYLFQFSFRRDGSVRFSEKSGRWGNFPSVLAGWRISSEDFWQKNVPFIDYFKLRASWGQMGNDAVDAFQYLSTYAFTTGMILGKSKTYSAGLNQSSTPNPIITWEVANVFNVGFESMFFNKKAKLDFEYFHQRRNDILITRNASVPEYTGVSLPDENYGIVDNKGFEAVLGYADKIGDWSFAINGNLAITRNSVVEFDEPARNVPWQVQTGHPMGCALLYKSIGIFRDAEQVESLPHVSGARPGDIIIMDYNDDGKITNDDRMLFDKTVDPEITYGLTLSLAYKNWRLNALVQGVGNCMRDMYIMLQGTGGNYFQYDADGRWTPDNITADKPRAWERDEEYWRVNYKTDYTYHNGAYTRLKNLQLSYTIPKNIQKAVWMKNAELYVSGQNLFLIHSGNKIIDPELGDSYNYPLMKVYSIGVNIAF